MLRQESFLIRPHGVRACVCARVCVHACSRGSLRSEVDAIQDVGERYERAATLSWRRLRLDEVVEPRCVLRLMKEATGASPDARAMMTEEATAGCAPGRPRPSYSRDLGPEPVTPRTCAEPKDDRRLATGHRAAVQAAREGRAHVGQHCLAPRSRAHWARLLSSASERTPCSMDPPARVKTR